MITKIYSNIKIPILEEKLPIDVHSIIGKFLGYSHHIFVYMKLTNNSNITTEIKKYLYLNCNPCFHLIELKNIDFDYEFNKYLIENMNNIVQIHKILPLFYKKTNDEKITSSEFIKLNEYLSKGYAVEYSYEYNEYYDSDDSFSIEENPMMSSKLFQIYRLNKYPIVNDISQSQTAIAFLAQNLNYQFKKVDFESHLYFDARYKIPSLRKLNKHCIKIKNKKKNEIWSTNRGIPAPGRL